jgi:hypothetical protein
MVCDERPRVRRTSASPASDRSPSWILESTGSGRGPPSIRSVRIGAVAADSRDEPDREAGLEHGRVLGDPARVADVGADLVAGAGPPEPGEEHQADQQRDGERDAADDDGHMA